MHIAIFVDFHDSTVGGVQTSVRGQRKGLEALGHKVTVVCPAPAGDVPDDPAVICVPALPFVRPNGFTLAVPSAKNRRFIEAALAQRGPVDIIHAQTNMGIGIMAVEIARRHAAPLVQTMHGRDDVFAKSFTFPYVTTLGSRLMHRRRVPHASPVPKRDDTPTAHNAWQIMVNQAQAADHVIMPSQHFADKFREHGVTQPITVISNGIDDEVVSKLPHAPRKRPRGNALRVMWCGRFSVEKRPIDAIAAVTRVPGCTLDLYGNGPLETTVRDHVAANGLADRVILNGRVNQAGILQAMQEHDILLYPSYGFDNQPMVLLEAVAAGIPVIYCDPDLTECMPADGALLTENPSVEAMADALATLQTNKARWQKMHAAMLDQRDKIVQSYHSKKMAKLYQQLLHQAKAS